MATSHSAISGSLECSPNVGPGPYMRPAAAPCIWLHDIPYRPYIPVGKLMQIKIGLDIRDSLLLLSSDLQTGTCQVSSDSFIWEKNPPQQFNLQNHAFPTPM